MGNKRKPSETGEISEIYETLKNRGMGYKFEVNENESRKADGSDK